ncbi:C4-dicarboxylic acid transporter DauA [Lacunisphaera limnophila]|uniref:C4-dicarboxylic acid transporter DauA n=1 Tax=Lacunisphaera limnophila TaxID=1838286 RepID=A0A1D8AZ36_9BACT|nr:SulP family inorganic anion transporter [Lacunisphaera limnophila]AOS46156.1 C4-dicarboxylic acid transporter DauA [Lacunisphaera limnophila]
MSKPDSTGLRPTAAFKFRPRFLALLQQGYTRQQAVTDVFSGMTVGLIALPLALALGVASIPAGVLTPFPAPAIGIFTAIIGGFIVSLLGGSRVQISGPTAAFVTVILLVVEKHGYDGLLLATVMAGIILVLMGASGLGTLIKFIPYPVTSGFTTGIAVAIMLGQAPQFLGLRGAEAVPSEFGEKIPWIFAHLPALNLPTLLIATSCALFIHLWPKYRARLHAERIPGAIIAMVVSAVAVLWLGWAQSAGVATIGTQFGPDAIPHGLPPFVWPEISLSRIRDLIGPATTIAVLGAIESLLSAVVADGLINDRHDSNTELIAQGVANIVCPFFCGMPVTGAIARTSANVKAGGRTPVAGLVHAVTLLLIVLFFSSYARFVPMAAIAAVLVIVAFRMGEWHELRRLHRMPRSDALVLLTTMGLTVVFDLVIAVEVGLILAAILFIKRMAETTEIAQVTDRDELETTEQIAHGKAIPEGVVVFRIFGPFFFGAAEKMEDALQRVGTLPRVLILRMQLVPAMDATALNALESIVERMQAAGGTVILSGPHRQPLDMMVQAGFIEKLGRRNIRAHFDAALVRAREILASPASHP